MIEFEISILPQNSGCEYHLDVLLATGRIISKLQEIYPEVKFTEVESYVNNYALNGIKNSGLIDEIQDWIDDNWHTYLNATKEKDC